MASRTSHVNPPQGTTYPVNPPQGTTYPVNSQRTTYPVNPQGAICPSADKVDSTMRGNPYLFGGPSSSSGQPYPYPGNQPYSSSSNQPYPGSQPSYLYPSGQPYSSSSSQAYPSSQVSSSQGKSDLDILDHSFEAIWPRVQQQIKLAPASAPMSGQKIRLWLNDPANASRIAQVTQLDLSCLGLKILPSEIGYFTGLTALYLHKNELSCLPDTIGRLTRLIKLSLNDNQLTQIPDPIIELPCLRGLLIENNPLDGETKQKISETPSLAHKRIQPVHNGSEALVSSSSSSSSPHSEGNPFTKAMNKAKKKFTTPSARREESPAAPALLSRNGYWFPENLSGGRSLLPYDNGNGPFS